jgi:uncharacterized membrane protein
VSALVPIAQEWLDSYTDRVVSLEQQQKEEAERAAQEALVAARAEAEALEDALRAMAGTITAFIITTYIIIIIIVVVVIIIVIIRLTGWWVR